MLIFDETLMIFEAFLGPKYIKKTCFLCFYRFFDLKIVSDVIVLKNMNGDFAVSRWSVKIRVFCFVLKLQNAKIQKNACIFIDFW